MSDLLKYNLGFTSAAFLFRDSVLLAKLYLSLGDWNMVRERVLSENLLQIRTIAAQKRIYSETYTRLKALSVKALEVIANGERDDQVHMIWYAICKKYALIRDFSVQVLSPKIRINTRDISEADFNVFYNNLAANHDELNHISISSRAKLTKNLFRMLVSAGIIDSDGKLCPISISKSVRQIVLEDNDIPLEIYPGI
ncbi:MAG TPA: DUF1819 family protein [Rectinema sp.]|jgi:hypothetical protein|nr:DUF1819 family protein [Rectinema sp.]HQH50283.1 DUF1819 family protein [Candidatus Cloacimonadota bacterium]